MEHGKIAPRQFTILIVMFITGSSILFAPSILASTALQDAWLGAIGGVAGGTLIVLMLAVLGDRLPNMTMIEMFKHAFGKWIGSAVGCLFIFHTFFLSAIMLRYIGDFLTTQMMPDTPIQALLIVFTLLILLGCGYGLETFSRSSEVFLPWAMLFLVVLAAFIAPRIQIEHFLPVLEKGVKPVIQSSLQLIGIPYLELSIFLMIYPYVSEPAKRKRAFLIGALTGGLLIIMVIALTLAVLGPYLTVRNIYPSYTLTKKISVGQFLQRVEALLAIVWFLTIFYKTVISFYATVHGFCQVFGLKRYQSIMTPFGMLAALYAIVVYPDLTFGIRFSAKIWLPYASIFGFLLPLLVLLFSLFRKRPSQQSASP